MLPVHWSLSPPFLYRPCMRRPGCFREPWSSGHLQVASLHLKPWTDLSVRFIHSHSVQFFLVSGRSRRRKPPAERSALYTYVPVTRCHTIRSGSISVPSLAEDNHTTPACSDSGAFLFLFVPVLLCPDALVYIVRPLLL